MLHLQTLVLMGGTVDLSHQISANGVSLGSSRVVMTRVPQFLKATAKFLERRWLHRLISTKSGVVLCPTWPGPNMPESSMQQLTRRSNVPALLLKTFPLLLLRLGQVSHSALR